MSAVSHMVRNITIFLQFLIIHNLLFHIVRHLDICLTMAALVLRNKGDSYRGCQTRIQPILAKLS